MGGVGRDGWALELGISMVWFEGLAEMNQQVERECLRPP